MTTTTSINLSSLDGSNGFHLEGASRSISDAGDVNGDGFDDVIFGVSDADLNGNNSGSSYVVFGKTSGFDATMDLSDLDGVNGFRLDGVAHDFSGASVSGAGDVNGDGFDDLIVSAPVADPNGSNSGSSYVVFGKAAGFGAAMNLSDLDGGNGFRVDGATGDFLGRLVSGAGDVNGDGFDDVIIGGAGRNEDYSFPVTTDYVMFGKVSGFDPTFNISDLDGSNGFRLDANSYEAATASLSNAGDINGDGYDDVIIGLVFPSPYNETIKGTESYVVFGKAAGFDAAANLSNLDGNSGFRLTGAGFDLYGGALEVSGAGDVNGDGFDDVIIGAPEANWNGYESGSSYVIFGKASGFDATMNLSDLDGDNGFRLDGERYDSSGRSVSGAGDVNGDGFGDLIVGVPGADPNGSNSGSSYVVFGKAAGFGAAMNLSDLDSGNGFRVDGATGDFLGSSVSGAGDVNGDGFDDLIVGAPGVGSNGNDSGSSYIIFGRRNFQGEVVYVGTPEDDNLTGTSADERFEAGDGNDTMSGGGGTDIFDGGNGDDVIRVPDLNFQTLDGGSGIDTLELIGGGIDLNLANFHDRINGIEIIDLTGNGDNTLTLTLADLVPKIEGNDGDHVVIRGGGWLDGGIDGDYHTYTNRNDVVLQINVAVSTNPPTLGGVFSFSSLNGINGFSLDGGEAYNLLGWSVSNAGDVNGDGFDDVITGVPGDNSSYVVFGKASGFDARLDLSALNGINGFRLDGVAYDFSGRSVSNAGDVNGDGFADMIIGARNADASYVVFGKASSFNARLDLSSLDGGNGFRLDGGAKILNSGISVSNAGDVNGDGFDDVIIGASDAGLNYSSFGSSFVVFGKASGFNALMDLSSLNGNNGFRLDGVAAGDSSGYSVSNAGDVNGDGFDDVIVGALYADSNGIDSGSSYVVFGRAAGFDATMDLSSLDGSNGFRLDGAAESDFSGRSVSNAGDVNGDGFDDVIIGAFGTDSGSGYVIFGRAFGFSATMDLTALDGNNGFRMDTGRFGGGSVSSAGDVNGDGLADMIVGGFGASYVVFGKASGFSATLDLTSLDGDNGLRLDDMKHGPLESVSGAGDVNGDGFDDLIIGTYRAYLGGSSYVIFGSRDFGRASPGIVGTPGDDNLTGTPLAERFEAGDGDDRMIGGGGADIFRGDSGDDVIGVPDLDFQLVDGGIGVDTLELMGGGINLHLADFRGRIDGIETIDLTGSGNNILTLTLTDLLSLSDTTDTFTVSGNVGDRVNGLIGGWMDGGIEGNYHAYNNQGTVLRIDTAVSTDWLMPGVSLADLNGSNGFRLDGATAYDESGHSVSSAGDVNGDGFDDVIIGAPSADLNGNDSGSSYVVFGKTSGVDAAMDLSDLDGSNGFRMDGTGSVGSGYSVSDAGDVNGDGFADVIIGAPFAGSSYVVFGKASGFDATLDLSILDGNNGFRLNGDRSGSSVSSAGDVNGDGFDDVIVGAGAVAYSNRSYTVSSYVVFGKVSGFEAKIDIGSLNGNNGFRLDGIVAGDYSRASVSSAGDINSDGFDDFIIGAAGADLNGDGTGSSYMVFGKASGFSATMDLASLDGSNGFRLDGTEKYDFSGQSVSNAGDVNGDGFDDVIIGAAGADLNGSGSGSSYVVFGKASGFVAAMSLSDLDGRNGFRLDGVNEGDSSGYSVSNAGDVNGDGFDDLLVGAPGANPNGSFYVGSSYVVFGKASGFGATMDLSSLDGDNGFRLDGGVTVYDESGRSVSSAGDVNGDGFADLIVGASDDDPNGGNFGSSYVIFGRSDFTGGNADFKGTPGDDVFTGTSTAESFEGGNGNDRMIGRGGADSFDGGAGNDYIRILGDDFQLVDGGAGTDTLGLAGNGLNLDLSSVIDKIHDIEIISLYGIGDNTLTLTAQDVIDLSGSTNTLKIKGNAGDSVVGLNSDWADGGVHGNFHTYTQGEAVILVGVNVTTDFA